MAEPTFILIQQVPENIDHLLTLVKQKIGGTPLEEITKIEIVKGGIYLHKLPTTLK